MTGHRADILVIDDELTVCRNCQKALREEGYDVSIALNGYEGLKRFRKEDFDVAIVDLKMPGIDGMEVVKTMKMEQPATEVIIMAGHSTIPLVVKGIKQGAADYIPKPFTLNEMILAVRKVLEHQAHEAERKDSETKIHKEAIIAILNKAAEDQEFLGKLTDSGSEALRGYELHPEEEAALISGDVGWIEAHIGELDDRLKTWLTCRLQQERW